MVSLYVRKKNRSFYLILSRNIFYSNNESNFSIMHPFLKILFLGEAGGHTFLPPSEKLLSLKVSIPFKSHGCICWNK